MRMISFDTLTVRPDVASPQAPRGSGQMPVVRPPALLFADGAPLASLPVEAPAFLVSAVLDAEITSA